MSDLMWQFAGGLLLLWVVYDLFAGYTFLHRKILRRQEAVLYWLTLGI